MSYLTGRDIFELIELDKTCEGEDEHHVRAVECERPGESFDTKNVDKRLTQLG